MVAEMEVGARWLLQVTAHHENYNRPPSEKERKGTYLCEPDDTRRVWSTHPRSLEFLPFAPFLPSLPSFLSVSLLSGRSFIFFPIRVSSFAFA